MNPEYTDKFLATARAAATDASSNDPQTVLHAAYDAIIRGDFDAFGEFVTDEICDRVCVLGTAEQAKAKLQELQGIGVDQFNSYLMTHGQEETLQAFGDEIIPDLATAPA